MKILDSENRREFGTGAVRDIQEGKGRMDLLPLDVVGDWMITNGERDHVVIAISRFTETADTSYLEAALNNFKEQNGWRQIDVILEVSKHFEEGAKKYGENNWQKGIPTHCYIDSAVRHYLKWLGDFADEPHGRAFIWNILCCIWTCKHHPELNDYAKRNE